MALWSDCLFSFPFPAFPSPTSQVPAATPLSPLTPAQGQGWEVVVTATWQPCGLWLLTPSVLSNHDDRNFLPSWPHCQLVHEYHFKREGMRDPNRRRDGQMDRKNKRGTRGVACAAERERFRNEFWWPIDPAPFFQFKKGGVTDEIIAGDQLNRGGFA